MSLYSSGNSVNAIVADIGSFASKVGFAGEDHPKAYFRSNVATLKEGDDAESKPTSETVSTSTKAGATTTGTSTTSASDDQSSNTQQPTPRRRRRPIEKVHYDSIYRPVNMESESDGNWRVSNPVDPVTGLLYDAQPYASSNSNADWSDLVPTFLQHGYESSLGMNSMEQNPLLLVERSYNPPPLRQQMLEILMEECQVPATFFGKDATMACYACGRTTSTVVDIGYSGTTVTPVYDGYVEQKGIRRCPIGSMAADEMALKHLEEVLKKLAEPKNKQLLPLYQIQYPKANRHSAFRRLSLLEIAKDCRQTGAGQSINTAASKTLQVPSMSFELPDGQMVEIPSQNRFEVADLIFGELTANNGDQEGQVFNSAALREDALSNLKSKFSDLVSTALTDPEEEEDDDDDDDSNNMDVDDEEKEAEAKDKEAQSGKYTEATAVGMSSRRTTRRGGGGLPQKSLVTAKSSSNKVRFNNPILQKACASYLEAHLDQALTAAPIAQMVCDAAFRCDRDQQASVLGNVVLAGGGACIGPTDQSAPDLLRDQMETIIHTHTPGWRVKVLSPGMQERSVCSWLGGSILGSLGTFHDMWITKAEYDEWGSAIINRKCP